MIRSILVPTDGSKLSEHAIPVVEQIASAQGAKVVLVRVVTPPIYLAATTPGYLDGATYQQIVDDQDDEATNFLDCSAQRLRARSICTRSLLMHGSPGAAILEAEETQHPDLVILATHGRSGLMRFTQGSVSDQLLRTGTAPVLMVRAFDTEPREIRNALVPVDGSDLAEECLPLLRELAGKPLVSADLIRVVRDESERAEAAEYLDTVAAQLASSSLLVHTHIRVGDPAHRIALRAAKTDLVMMATHGRGGFDRWRHGSVAGELITTTSAPILLVRGKGCTQGERSSAGPEVSR